MANDGDSRSDVTFAHPSEAEFSRILDFYQISWEYEPRTFELKWDGDGNVVEAFSPDFYLPEQDLYIELTTMDQKLITKKHRKLRRLRELYPQVNIKLLNRSDFQHMMLKYGLDDDQALIGST
jgi:hypothetical protein